MKCPGCGFDNIEKAKFCNECGNRMEIPCPSCETRNALASKFCFECGSRLGVQPGGLPGSLSFDEKLAKIQKYLPKGLTEKILAQKERIEGERKLVTAMFCDMEGFTSLVEKLGPDEAYVIMDKVYEILIHKVHDYEGTVNEMTGDGIMALFGAPIALEDAPQRAIRSALAIHREITQFSNSMNRQELGLPQLKMRIGIHTGPVVVGTLGNDLRVDFKAVGDTVNMASRMEGLAEPGTTYVTDETYRTTEGLFRFESLGPRHVKGKEQLVEVYRVIAPSTRRTRFDVSAERGLTPLVGRERELELLRDGFDRSKGGRGQAFSIVSEAGVGKSRLLYEFRKSLVSDNVMFLEGRCLSYSRGVAYHPVIDILRANFDIRDGDDDSLIRNKVVKGLRILNMDETATLPYILELLSVESSGIDNMSVSPETKKDRIIDALKRIVIKGSEIRPLILAYEDLHWADKSSEEVLKYVLESIAGARVLMLFTYRPEFVHTWGARSYHNQITLNRLSNRESLRMVYHLLGTHEVASDLEELILGKTEGIPFFIEEFIRSLRDLQVFERRDGRVYLAGDVKNVTIPSTIQDVIMSRVDALQDGAKDVLQAGSSIEREFNHDLIKRVTNLPEEELISYLSALKDSELIYERGIYPQSTYVFRHALTREVVYDSILKNRRRQLHEEIGNGIEELQKENLTEFYGVLIEHFVESENYGKAAAYAKLASKRARKTGSFGDAITHEERRVSFLEALPQTTGMEAEIIDARATLGMYYTQINNFVLARESVSSIGYQAIKLGNKRRIAQIYAVLGIYAYAVEENISKALEFLNEAIIFGSESRDLITLIMGNHYLGHLYADNCEFEKALDHLNKSLEINVAANVSWGIAVHKGCIARTVHCYQGDMDLALQTGHEALELSEKSGDIYSQGEAHVSLGYAYYGKGLLYEAENHLIEGNDLTGRLNMVALQALASACLGDTYFHRGEYSKSIGFYESGIHIQEQCGQLHSSTIYYKLGLARSRLLNGETPDDIETLYRYVSDNKFKLLEGAMKRRIGEMLSHMGEQYISKAEMWIKKAIAADEHNGLPWQLAMDRARYADFCQRKGDLPLARSNLGVAISHFKECGAEGWISKYEEKLVKPL